MPSHVTDEIRKLVSEQNAKSEERHAELGTATADPKWNGTG